MSAVGAACGLASPLAASAGVFVWGESWQGSAFALNLVECSAASAAFVACGGHGLVGAHAGTLLWLVLSGFVGIVVGDVAWLAALRRLGARRVILVDSLEPFLAAVLAYHFLAQPAPPLLLAGAAVTVAGVLVVSLERTAPRRAAASSVDAAEDAGADVSGVADSEEVRLAEDGKGADAEEKRSLAVGYALAVINVVLDTVGAVLTRYHAEALTTFEVNTVRFGAAAVLLALVSVAARLAGPPPAWATLPAMPRRAWAQVLGGVALTTFAAPALGNVALFRLPLATHATLGALAPVYALPLGYVVRRDPVTLRALAGAALACAGVALLGVHGL